MHAIARLALLAVTAALVATALPVAADEGSLLASAVEYDGLSTQSGGLALLFVQGGVLDANGDYVSAARPWLDLEAASLAAVEYETERTEAEVPAGPLPLEFSGPGDQKETPSSYTAATAHMTEFQPGFQVHVYTLQGTIAYSAEATGGNLRPDDAAIMGPGHYGEGSQGSPPSETTPPITFARVERPGPWVLHAATAPKFSIALQGDFVVEMAGLTLAVEGDGGQGQLRSGTWEEPLDPNAPPQGSEAAHKVTQRFVRIQLTDAVLEFATEAGSPDIAWAASDVVSDFTSEATLLDANGKLDTAAGSVDLRHARQVLPGGSRLQLAPQGDRQLLVGVSPTPLSPHGGTIANVPAPASAALIGTGAILALAIAIGIGVLRRVLRLPALADVETALEEGEFRKAARLAGRILSRLPGSEEALLGRAIALSKVGRHQDVITELTRHLALRPATDGTLHYVLGLAQLDSGKAAEGQASLREAVRLTPALQEEVAPRLGKAFSVAQPTTRETTNGYA
jgi:hypothetical protein